MKLLHIISATDPESGGPIEALLRISEVLIRDGHEVEVVSLEDEAEVIRRKFPFAVTGLGRGTKPLVTIHTSRHGFERTPGISMWLSCTDCGTTPLWARGAD